MTLNRVSSSLKPQVMTINLPVNGLLAEQGGDTIRVIPTRHKWAINKALAAQSKIIEIDELTQRIEAMES